MSDEYPLYPILSKEAQDEAQEIMNVFKVKMAKICDETLGDLYCNTVNYIESDSWTNFRDELLDGFRNYANRKIQAEYDFKKIRESILNNHREEIICDLNADLLKENEDLKTELKECREYYSR